MAKELRLQDETSEDTRSSMSVAESELRERQKRSEAGGSGYFFVAGHRSGSTHTTRRERGYGCEILLGVERRAPLRVVRRPEVVGKHHQQHTTKRLSVLIPVRSLIYGSTS
ncbi:hypothetical protein Tcan_07214 [Toxocara canis]|uniref:Uncharacterized protein n=1 Tax=Toxocara canis TaxID=6265 RepID=A0A0B2VJK8_TOXCA|nr:hypothetical protein Tcan_07214 [Toxocara canis]